MWICLETMFKTRNVLARQLWNIFLGPCYIYSNKNDIGVFSGEIGSETSNTSLVWCGKIIVATDNLQ